MKKIIIGIIGRKTESNDDLSFYGNMIGYDYMKVLDKLDVDYLGIITNDGYKEVNEDILKLCDGILFPGGSEIKPYHYQILDYAYKNKVPTLGICLGSQAIGLYFSKQKELETVKNISEVNHNPVLKNVDERKLPVHSINIKENTILSRLFGNKIMVNSRHNYCLSSVISPLEVTATSDDGIIEAVELIDKEQFMLGVQWHPENMEDMFPLFKEFIEHVKYNQKKKSK